MKELYQIMRELLEVEYNQKSLQYVLEILEKGYDDEREEEAMIVNGIKYYLTALQTELRTAINRLDIYIAERKRYSKDSPAQAEK